MAIPHQEINLRDLSLSEAQNMVESLLKTDTLPKDLQLFIREKVEGNPFYLEEAINSLIESNILIPQNGNWKALRPITEAEISATIQGVISARVDRLEQESKRILQEASVIGRSFYYDIIKRISKIKDNIDRNLSGLERFDLIKTKSIRPYLEYIFKHALTQEVVYNGLLKKERREIHEQIGNVIEELFKDRLPEFYETLAFHFKKGHSNEKAVHYLMKSGEKSLKRYAVDESHQVYKEAFEILCDLKNETKENSELLIKLTIDWAMVYYYRGDFKGLTALLETHEAIAKTLDDKEVQGMFYAWLGFTLYFRGKYNDSYQKLLKALEIGQELNVPKIVGYACTWLTTTCTDIGLHDEAIEFGLRAQVISKKMPEDHYLYFKPLWGLSYIYYNQGYGKKCLHIGKQLLDYGNKHSNIRCLVVAHICEGLGHFLTGDFLAAIKSLELGVAVAVDPFYSIWVKMFLAPTYLLNNQVDEAEKALEEIWTYSDDFGCEMITNYVKMFLGIVSILKGNMSKGINMIEELKHVSIESERIRWSAQFENTLGRVYLQIAQGGEKPSLPFLIKNIGFLIKNAPRADRKSEAHFNKAIEQSKKIGDNGLLGQAHLNLGLLHKAKNRIDKAKECFSEAIKFFEETEAEVFLKQAKELQASVK
jgi:tetratricopeptide (TPR) repeat protein